MAVVYLARQLDLDRNVALKELSAFHAGSREFAERFLRESRLAGSLSHPNIVTVHEYFEEAGIPHIAMEYVPGGSLRPRVGTLSLAQLVGVLEGILAALAYAEPSGIVHRDLKPENIMVTGDGRVKIADFGIAKATQGVGTAAFMTATGMTVGTPTYMAPEQAMAQEIGPWTDLYSVGVIAHEQIIGRAPFQDSEAPMVILMRHVNERIPSVAELKPNVDPALSDWVDRLLIKDHTERTSTAVQAWEELEEIVLRLVGPRWRREARLPERGPTRQTPAPLTPAPFESKSVKTPEPGPAAAPRSEFLTFDPGSPEAPVAADSSAIAPGPAVAQTDQTPAPSDSIVAPAGDVDASLEHAVEERRDVAEEEPAAIDGPPAATGAVAEPAGEVLLAPGEQTEPDDAESSFITFGAQSEPADQGAPGVAEPQAPPPGQPAAPHAPGETRAPVSATGAITPERARDEPVATAGPDLAAPRAPTPAGGASLTHAPSAARAPADSATAEAPPGRTRRGVSQALIAAGIASAAVAAVIGYVASSGGGGKSTSSARSLASTVSAGPLSLKIPATWQRIGTFSPPGSGFEHPLAVQQTAGSPVLAVEHMPEVSSPSLLPTSLVARVQGVSQEPVRLGGNVDFYRYRNVPPVGGGEPQTIYTTPTTAGAVVGVCEAPTAAAARAGAECERILGTLTVSSATFLPLGPLPGYATALNRAISAVKKESNTVGTQLKRASKASAQATAARRLAQIYDQSASAVRGASPGPLERSTNDAIAVALAQAASGYGRMAAAAKSGSNGGWSAGTGGVRAGLAKLQAAFASLRKLGFTVSS
jgi:hypothetical protein